MQPFSPTKQVLAATDRLIVVKGKIYVEDINVYSKRSCFSKFIKRERYNSKKLLDVLDTFAEKYKSKDNLPKITLLNQNLERAFHQVKQENIRVIFSNCFKRAFYKLKCVDLKKYESNGAILNSKLTHEKLVNLKVKFDELRKQDSTFKKIQNPQSQDFTNFIQQVKDIKNALNLLNGMKQNANNHDLKEIQLAENKFNSLQSNLNKSLVRFDNLIIRECQKQAQNKNHLSNNIDALIDFLEDWNLVATRFSSKLSALKQPELSSPLLIAELIEGCLYENKKYVENYKSETSKKIEGIVQSLKDDTKNIVFDKDYADKVGLAVSKTKKQYKDLSKSLKKNYYGINTINENLKKIDGAYAAIKNKSDELLALQNEFNEQISKPLSTIEDCVEALEYYKYAEKRLSQFDSTIDKINFLAGPSVLLSKLIKNQMKADSNYLKELIIKKMVLDHEENIKKRDRLISGIDLLNDESAGLKSFQTLLKTSEVEGKATILNLHLVTSEDANEIRKIQFGNLQNYQHKIVLKFHEEIENIINGNHSLNFKEETIRLDNLKRCQKLLSCYIDTSKIKNQISALINVLDNVAKDEYCARNVRLVRTKKLLFDDIEQEIGLLSKYSDVGVFVKNCDKLLNQWQEDSKESLTYIADYESSTAQHISPAKHDPSMEITSIVNAVTDDLSCYEKFSGKSGKHKAYRKEIEDAKESLKQDNSPKNLQEQLNILTALVPISKFPKTKANIPFIERFKTDFNKELKRLKQEQSDCIISLKAQIKSHNDDTNNDWEACFKDFADDETIFDIIGDEDNEFDLSLHSSSETFVSFLNTCIDSYNKKGGKLGPLVLTVEAIANQRTTLPDIFDTISLLEIGDYRDNKIYSLQKFKNYLNKNIVSCHQKLKATGYFE